MYIAIISRTYPSTRFEEVLDAAAGDGYQGVQFSFISAGLGGLPDHIPDGLAVRIGEYARAKGLRLAALSGTYNMAHPDPDARVRSRAGFRAVVEAARRMGAPVVTLCTGTRDATDMWKHHPENESELAWRDFRTELDLALIAAEAAGVKLGIEPEPGNVISDAKRARRVLDEVRSPRLGIVLDAANLLSAEKLAVQERIFEEAIELLGNDILIAHAKDIDSGGRVVAAGEGAVRLESFVTRVRETGFDGALIGHGFPAEKTQAVAKVLARLAGIAA